MGNFAAKWSKNTKNNLKQNTAKIPKLASFAAVGMFLCHTGTIYFRQVKV